MKTVLITTVTAFVAATAVLCFSSKVNSDFGNLMVRPGTEKSWAAIDSHSPVLGFAGKVFGWREENKPFYDVERPNPGEPIVTLRGLYPVTVCAGIIFWVSCLLLIGIGLKSAIGRRKRDNEIQASC